MGKEKLNPLERKALTKEKLSVVPVDEAKLAAREYFKGDELSANAWVKKYALKDSQGNLYERTPEDMHHRLADEIARIEKKYENPMTEQELFDLIKDFKYIVPQGGPMTGIGNNLQISSISNCFVIGYDEDAHDSYGTIMKVDQEQVQLMKRRGGVGHDLSYIRPRNSGVENSALTSTGVGPFMERYSNSTKEVAQEGRRGALMLTINVKHPDVMEFIDMKMDTNKVNSANVSVRIDDEFMNALEKGTKYSLQYPINSENPEIRFEVNPKQIWNKIIHNAWKSAEPGVLFWDTIIRESIADRYSDQGFKTTSTNPCGEIPLNPYDACRLLAINLYSYVDDPFTEKAKFNWDKFKTHVGCAQVISDDIIDLESEKVETILEKIEMDPEDEFVKATEKNLWKSIKKFTNLGRRMGVGVTGEGDMLASLGYRYGTEEATQFATEVHKTIAVESYRSSVELAKTRGKFPIYDPEKEKGSPFIERLREEDPGLVAEMEKYGRRNIALLTIAPTGTTSLMTQTSSGIEPTFDVVYKRRRKVDSDKENANIVKIDEHGDSWEEYNVFHHKFADWLKVNGYNVEEVQEYDDGQLNELIHKSPYYRATAGDLNWVERVNMQGAIQKWVDHSISSTVNLPEHVDEELVDELYRTAWKKGAKGVTIYRDGSRDPILKRKGKKEGGLEEITLIQKNVKTDRRLQIKPQAIKYKVKRLNNKDSLHFILTSDLYVDDKNKKAYFIPDEDFQVRVPLGAATSVSFSQSGMDRTQILRGPNPDYAEFVKRLQSPFSNEDEGIGPNRIKSLEHAAGLVFEDYLTRNGIIGNDEHTGELVNIINKSELRKVERDTEEYNSIVSQVRIGPENEEEIVINGNIGKPESVFICERCGPAPFRREAGCDNPVCKLCGWSDPNKSCA